MTDEEIKNLFDAATEDWMKCEGDPLEEPDKYPAYAHWLVLLKLGVFG